MDAYITTILSGIFVSLAGSLPLGNLNVAAMHIAAKEPIKNALQFALGVVLVEMLYLWFTLQAINWVTANPSVFSTLQWLTVALLIALAIGSFWGARKNSSDAKNVIIENNINRFLLGMGMSAVNPMQVPYWGGWAVYLITQQWLLQEAIYYNIFTFSAGIGTSVALLLFILAGRRLANYMNKNKRKVLIITGILFLVMAIVQIFNIT